MDTPKCKDCFYLVNGNKGKEWWWCGSDIRKYENIEEERLNGRCGPAGELFEPKEEKP